MIRTTIGPLLMLFSFFPSVRSCFIRTTQSEQQKTPPLYRQKWLKAPKDDGVFPVVTIDFHNKATRLCWLEHARMSFSF
jgi:hypothetical protein